MSPEEALAVLGPPAGASPDTPPAEVLQCLRQTALSSTWLVHVGGQPAVLRLDTPRVRELGLDREREWVILGAAAAAGLGPAPLARDLGRGLLLRAYVQGRAWEAEDLRDRARLPALARCLRALHRIPPAGEALDLATTIHRYARLGGAPATAVARQARDALAACPGVATGLVLCHNDPVAGNLIEPGTGDAPAGGSATPSGPERLVLIDWEYAAPGNPWFDLAAVVAHHDLDAAAARDFLQAYLGRAPDEGDQACLAAWCHLYRNLAALWALALRPM